MLPPDFTFSQQNLQDYQNCPRRFYLRYIEHLEWPAIESEPVLEQERLIELGQTFHTMVQQSLSGIPVEIIRSGIQSEQLERWWANFEAFDLDVSSKTCLVEEMISVPLAGHRLVAKFDLLTIDEQHKFVIYDWKTSLKPPKRSSLLYRVQSMVYPYVAVRASAALTHGDAIEPEKVRMIYWYPEHPQDGVELGYSASKYAKDEQELVGWINTISSLDGRKDFPKTENRNLCKICGFRSFCGRGDTPGSNDGEDEPSSTSSDDPFKIDFEAF